MTRKGWYPRKCSPCPALGETSPSLLNATIPLAGLVAEVGLRTHRGWTSRVDSRELRTRMTSFAFDVEPSPERGG